MLTSETVVQIFCDVHCSLLTFMAERLNTFIKNNL